MKRDRHETMTIVEAVETLTSMAELDPIQEEQIRQDLLIEGKHIGERKVDWLATGDDGKETVDLVKETFKTVHSYLKDKWRQMDPSMMDSETMEGIKTVMLLAGEAAKRLNHFTNLFWDVGGSAYNLSEWQDLHDFYQRKINPKVSEEMLGKWILGVGRLPFPEVTATTDRKKAVEVNPLHLFVDMEAVRQDSEHELFFIRKGDGTRFFNPKLIRSMKLVTEFGFRPAKDLDPVPFIEVDEWLDIAANQGSKRIIQRLGVHLDFFYMERTKFKEKDLINTMSYMFLSLLLASHNRYLYSQQNGKCCLDFFDDFLHFFRAALHSYEFQKIISYPPSEHNRLARLIIRLMRTVATVLYSEMTQVMEGKGLVKRLIREGYNRDDSLDESRLTGSIAEDLWMDHLALSAGLEGYLNSPLNRILDEIEHSPFAGYDPWMQKNLPNRVGVLEEGNKRIEIMRLPTPTIQEQIETPKLLEEFKTFIEGLEPTEKLLLLNFQNRNSWKEGPRSRLIEDLENREPYKEPVEVVTLEVDSDFYEQLSPYDTTNDATKFKESLRERLGSKEGGYFFTLEMEDQLFPLFVDETIEEVHQLFFEGKNRLTQPERRSYIDLVHLFISWKLVDLVDPAYVAFSCKDGVDTSSTAYALMWYGHIAFNGRLFGQTERDQLNTLLFAPPVIIRERDIQPARLDRFIQTLRTIQEASQHLGEKNFVEALRKQFGRMFHSPIFEGIFRI